MLSSIVSYYCNIGGIWHKYDISLKLICWKGSIKQQNTFTTVTAANAEELKLAIVVVLAAKLKSIEECSYNKWLYTQSSR